MGPEIMSISEEKEGFTFDMQGACKYYTRLMNGRLKRNHSLAELAALTGPVEESLSVKELPRFVEALCVDQLDDAQVHCRLETLSEEALKVRITGQVTANVLTQCQRCLDGLPLELVVPVDWKLPEDIQAGGDVKAHEIELRMLDWIEDDLCLSIPLFAKHADVQCGGELANSYLAADDEEHVPDTVTPFDGLKDLLSK